MRFLVKVTLFLFVLLPLAGAAAVFLTIDTQPTIERTAAITPSTIERAKRILDQNDPRKLKPGTRRTILLSNDDLDRAANYVANRYGGGSAQVGLQNGSAQLAASLRIPRLPLNLYLNVDATVVEQTPLPRLTAVRIGRLPVPTWMAHWAIAYGPRAFGLDLEKVSWSKIIHHVTIRERAVAITYEWQENAFTSLRGVVIPSEDRERIAIYQELLVSITEKYGRRSISLVDLLVPLFQLTRERGPYGDAAGENRAAILVLAFYVSGESLGRIVPELKSRRAPVQHQVLLGQRDDFAKHFMVSAAFAASAGSPLADALGLYKEIADSRGGSGFSFNDIAADRAGVRFGESAANSASAGKLQTKVGAGIVETDFMPDTADLPEYMAEAEFKRRFGGVNGAAYKRMMAEIERRVAALPLYH